MAPLLLMSLTPVAVLVLGSWWSRRFAPASPEVAVVVPAAGDVPVARVVRDVLCHLGSSAARQFVRLEAAVAETLMIGGDRRALEELLSVLCLHAIETTPCGRVLVAASHRGGSVAIAIVDDGIGVATVRTAAMLERSHEVLTLLGGQLEIRRRQGVGTTMAVLLPALLAGAAPWDATIRSTMADFARVTETQSHGGNATDSHAPPRRCEDSLPTPYRS